MFDIAKVITKVDGINHLCRGLRKSHLARNPDAKLTKKERYVREFRAWVAKNHHYETSR